MNREKKALIVFALFIVLAGGGKGVYVQLRIIDSYYIQIKKNLDELKLQYFYP